MQATASSGRAEDQRMQAHAHALSVCDTRRDVQSVICSWSGSYAVVVGVTLICGLDAYLGVLKA
jgi:hypothetical protein